MTAKRPDVDRRVAHRGGEDVDARQEVPPLAQQIHEHRVPGSHPAERDRQETDERRDRPQGAGIEEIDVRADGAEQRERDDEGEPANDQRQGARRHQAAGGREERVEGVEEIFDLPRVR